MVVIAQSSDYATTVQQEITGLYGNNISVILNHY
jgi:hypothetical protein